MAEQKPIPIRLSQDVIDRLDEQAAMMGSNRAALIRYCTKTFLDHIEKTGMGGLPADWQSIVAQSDGRRKESEPAPRLKVDYRNKPKPKTKPKKP